MSGHAVPRRFVSRRGHKPPQARPARYLSAARVRPVRKLRAVLTPSLLMLIVSCLPARAASVAGRVTTSLHSYERRTAQGTVALLRAYQSVRLDVAPVSSSRLSLHTHVRAATDLRQRSHADPGTRVSSAYARWRMRTCTLRAGRQHVFTGVGSGILDGLRTDVTRGRLRATAFAGALAPLHSAATPGTWKAGHLWGARARMNGFLGMDLGLSFATRAHTPSAYDQPGRYSGVAVHAAELEERLVGISLKRRVHGAHSLRGAWVYDLRGKKMRRAELGGVYAPSRRVSLHAEWRRRESAILRHSIFSVFPHEAYQEIAARLYLRLSERIQLSAYLTTVLLHGDSAQRLGASISVGGNCSLGYYRSMGYARLSDGLVGSLYWPLGRQLTLRGELNFTAYEQYGDATGRDELVAGTVSLGYRLDSRTRVQVELQSLSNPVYAIDTRLILRVSRRFFRSGRSR